MKFAKEWKEFKCPKNPRDVHTFWRVWEHELKRPFKRDPKPLSVRFIHR